MLRGFININTEPDTEAITERASTRISSANKPSGSQTMRGGGIGSSQSQRIILHQRNASARGPRGLRPATSGAASTSNILARVSD